MESSKCYTDEWAAKLFRGFDRNLTLPHRNVLFTDRQRELPSSIEQIVQPDLGQNGYGDCVRPFVLNKPMIFVGLDTIVVGSCDKFARWCLQHPGKLALPRHPYEGWAINGVVFWGGGNPAIFYTWRGEGNDMAWMRSWPHVLIDDLWRDRIISYKARVAKQKALPQAARIVYFHGPPKPHELMHLDWIKECWR